MKKQDIKIPGIYLIHCSRNNKVYVGSSINTTNRLWDHKTKLNANKHISTHMQSAYNLYGKNTFSFSLIEECTEDKFVERESYWIRFYDSTNPDKGYNILIPDLEYDWDKVRNKRKKIASTKNKKIIVINYLTNDRQIYNSITEVCSITGVKYNKVNSILYYWKIFNSKEEYKRKDKLKQYNNFVFIREFDYNQEIDYTKSKLPERQKVNRKKGYKMEPRSMSQRAIKRREKEKETIQ